MKAQEIAKVSVIPPPWIMNVRQGCMTLWPSPPPLPPAFKICIPLHVPVTNHHTDLAKTRLAEHRKYHIQAF